ncbi:MAG: cell division protein ZapA [Proteobacteria bacterium]|nr:cell division protein ZapA [Pseudomonadota bacterium]
MIKNVSVKIGRKNYLLTADSDADKKDLLNASAVADNLAEAFIKGNPNTTNEDVLMLTCLSLSHELEAFKKKQESEEKVLEQLHNSLADKLENLI